MQLPSCLCIRQTNLGKAPLLSCNNILDHLTHALFSKTTSPHATPFSLTYLISGSLKLVNYQHDPGSSPDSMLSFLLKMSLATPCMLVALWPLPLLAPPLIASTSGNAGCELIEL